MHRYLLFAGDEYHPNGGWDDYIVSCPTVEQCIALCKWTKIAIGYTLSVDHPDWQTDSFYGHWMHVVDSRTGEIVYHMTSFKMKENEPKKPDTS